VTIRKLIEDTQEDLEKLEEGCDEDGVEYEVRYSRLRWLVDHLLEQMDDLASGEEED
jgi:hypothetical protein